MTRSHERLSGPSKALSGQSPARSRTGLIRAGNRAPDFVAFEDAVVAFFVGTAEMLGVPKSVAAIYGVYFASPEPLSFSDINERLDISSGSISQGLRVLRDVGALKIARPENPNAQVGENATGGPSIAPSHVEKNGDKSVDNVATRSTLNRSRECYEPDLELRKLMLHWIEKRLQGQLTSGRSRLREIVDSIPKAFPSSGETLRLRFESLLTWHDKAHSLVPVAKTFLKLT